jgi:hypothetical protein
VTGALPGERWWLGDAGTGVLLEVRKPVPARARRYAARG